MADVSSEQDVRFHRVCSLDDLWAGEMQVFDVGGVHVLVVHTEDGNVTAVQAICPHQAVPLIEGTLCGRILTCPMHLWDMDVVSGKGINPDHAELARYPVETRDGNVYVAIDGVQPKFSRP
jgi:toluene monooxygenase system ferredoxin subunit